MKKRPKKEQNEASVIFLLLEFHDFPSGCLFELSALQNT